MTRSERDELRALLRKTTEQSERFAVFVTARPHFAEHRDGQTESFQRQLESVVRSAVHALPSLLDQLDALESECARLKGQS